MKKEFVIEARSLGNWKALGQALMAAAALLSATANCVASHAQKNAEPESYRRVAFVGTAVAKSTVGDVEYFSGTKWVPAKAGQVFNCEQICRTKGNGKAVFQMRTSGSLVRVAENTIVRFCALDQTMAVASLTGYEAAAGGATVRAVRGAAEYLNKDSKWQTIRVNSTLPAGATVRTLEKTIVDLFFADSGLVMRISPDSQVILNQIPVVAAGEIQTNQKTGSLLAQVDTSSR
ncbi:MAG: hypothetical protein JWM99_5076 [Verrucomicrobiales bacterium]|jgi:hypothetical protein|nr:hypothetical protein [Verrucomicrobiales bacterium]